MESGRQKGVWGSFVATEGWLIDEAYMVASEEFSETETTGKNIQNGAPVAGGNATFGGGARRI